jgi:enoyl-CoA hydratase/carnithine racemase
VTDDVLVDRAGPVASITFNRPHRRNSFTTGMLVDVRRALLDCEADPAVRVVVLRGAGGVFSSGADLSALNTSDSVAVRHSNRAWIDMFATIERLELPVLASVSGPAVAGGTELTLACDLVVAAESSMFGLSEMRVGVIPGAGACVRLTRWVGRAVAKELLFTGDPITARRAYEVGLVNRVVPDGDLEEATAHLTELLASRSPAALAAAKRAVNIGSELDLDRGVEYVLGEFAALFDQPDQAEGMNAFLEKRTPVFAPRRPRGDAR